MKTIRKYKKRKSMKNRRRNKYIFKGGAGSEDGKKDEGKEGEEKGKDEEGKDEEKGKEEKEGEEGEDELKPGDVVEDVDGNKWTLKEDSSFGPIYYTVWTNGGEPIYIWTKGTIDFFKGDFKKKMIAWFMSVNPTAVLVKTATESAIDVIKDNKEGIQEVQEIFASVKAPTIDIPNIETPNINIETPKIPKLETSINVTAAHGGTRKIRRHKRRKHRKSTRRRKK